MKDVRTQSGGLVSGLRSGSVMVADRFVDENVAVWYAFHGADGEHAPFDQTFAVAIFERRTRSGKARYDAKSVSLTGRDSFELAQVT